MEPIEHKLTHSECMRSAVGILARVDVFKQAVTALSLKKHVMKLSPEDSKALSNIRGELRDAIAVEIYWVSHHGYPAAHIRSSSGGFKAPEAFWAKGLIDGEIPIDEPNDPE